METEITILLDEFYENDTVVVSVDSVEVYNKHNVTTKLTISLADEFKVNATSEQVTIAVKVPTRNTRQVETVNVEGARAKNVQSRYI